MGAIPRFELRINMVISKHFQRFTLSAAGGIDFNRVKSSPGDQEEAYIVIQMNIMMTPEQEDS